MDGSSPLTATLAQFPKLPAEPLPHVAPEWPLPDPRFANGGARPAPPFPQDCFRTLAPSIVALAANKSASADYVALTLLVTAAGTVGAARSVQLRQGFVQPSVLNAMLVGDPSSGKSATFTPFREAMQAMERDERGAADGDRRAHETEAQAARERRDRWELAVKAATKEGAPIPPLPADADPPADWTPPRILVANATVEALAKLFGGSPRGLLLMRDELSGLFGNFGKYGGDGDRAFYLEAFDGVFAPTDRVKAGHNGAERALLSVVGGIQPARLQEQLLDGTNDGLVSRFLVVWPDPSAARWMVPDADHTFVTRVLRRLRGLSMETDSEGKHTPRLLPLAPDASAIFGAWYEEQHVRARAESGYIAEFLGKSYGVAGRIALILELLEWSATPDGPAEGPVVVSAASVACALRLHADYFEPMARRVYCDCANTPAESRARALLAELRKRRCARFNAVEARRGWGVSGLTAGDAQPMDEVLAILEDADCIRKAPTTGTGPGRKARDYIVNPHLLEPKP